MEGIAASLIIKIIVMMIFVIILCIAALYFFKNKLFSRINSQYFKVIDTVLISHKDRILDFEYKNNAYVLYINQNNCVLLDKRDSVSDAEVDSSVNDKKTFKDIIGKVYKP